MGHLRWGLVFLGLTSFVPLASAKVVYVNRAAPGPAPDGLSWASAFQSVADGLAAATSRDEVWVAKGTYTGSVTVSANVSLYGGFAGTETERNQRDWAANEVMLDGDSLNAVVFCQVPGVTVDGFTIRNWAGGSGLSGCSSAANNIIRGDGYFNNYYGVYGCPLLINNTISGFNDGVYVAGGTATIIGNRIFDCDVGLRVDNESAVTMLGNRVFGNRGSGVALLWGTATLRNNIISGNAQAGVWVSAEATLVNNTITGNGGDGVSIWKPVQMANNIIAFNGRTGVVNKSSTPGTVVTFSHNDVFGNVVSDISGFTPSEFEDNISLDPKLTNPYDEVHLQPDSPCRDAGDDFALDAGDADIDGQPRIQGTHVDIGADESDGTAWPLKPVVRYVSPSGAPPNDGLSWATAKPHVLLALAEAKPTDEIWVAGGEYDMRTTLIPMAVSLYGGFAGTETERDQRDWIANPTVLDNHGRYEPVLISRLPGVVVDGFTICGGFLGMGANGGLTVITHNVVTGNGTGLAINGGATISHNVISTNYSETLSGVYVNGGLVRFVNNTISHNYSTGLEIDSAEVHLTNNIIAFNWKGIRRRASSASGIPIFSHNDVFGNTTDYENFTPPADQGNLSVDPLFAGRAADNYRLMPGSPCIDAGDDAVVQPGDTDLDGKPRLIGTHVDMGAFESDPAAPTPPYTLAEAARCLRVSSGEFECSAEEITRLNVAAENPGLDFLDACRLARKVAGLEPNP